ncbi:alpha/beta hydrolase [[Phormidium] sp. ETS-05]|uniref:alpha/beta hydrolase n=1 Tax=[Phormidium] sp. ETS-05 TaxID=222819 RepID=UPI0018EECBA0|nr:alpha/beta hydrolase [[Phormidium] sp. ETS-05]
MDKKKIRRLLVGEFSLMRLVRSVIFIYTAVGVWAYFGTDRQIFLPQPSSYTDHPNTFSLPSANGALIRAIHLPSPQAKYTILYSHGNAEDLGDVLPTLQALQNSGFSVFAYDYQGYGQSEGSPTVANAYEDISAAYQYLRDRLGVPPQQIIIYGRSVGGGPSTYLASREPIAGLILESTFVSAFRVVTHIPIFPFDKFPNLHHLQQVNSPVLIIHGTQDEVVPFWHGETLFAAAKEPKRFLPVEGAGHDDLMWIAGDKYTVALQDFAALLGGNFTK